MTKSNQWVYIDIRVCVAWVYLHTGLDILELIHDREDSLHAAVLHQVRLVPHKNQGHPAAKPVTLNKHFLFQRN